MKRNVYEIGVEIRKSGVKGVPYCVNGKNCNGGEAAEIAYKDALGLAAVKDANGAFDITDDIPELGASVKSKGFTLVNRKLGDTKDAILDAYFEAVHSTSFHYIRIDDTFEKLTAYIMNATEFRTFLQKFGKMEAGRNVIRVRNETAEVVRWLDRSAR